MSKKLVRPIPQGIEHDWTIEVDGQPIRANHIVFSNPKFGELSFGQRPEGTVGWIWHEASGGGQGVVPYSVIGDFLFIGLVQESRPTLSGLAWNVPRGFINPNETHFESAKRELREEVGDISQLEMQELNGLPTNPNSTFFDTSTKDEGFTFFGLKVQSAILEQDTSISFFHQDRHYSAYRFKDNSIKPLSKGGEKIIRCLFVPWFKAASVQDVFTGMGVLRLLATHPELISYL